MLVTYSRTAYAVQHNFGLVDASCFDSSYMMGERSSLSDWTIPRAIYARTLRHYQRSRAIRQYH